LSITDSSSASGNACSSSAWMVAVPDWVFMVRS
jgi:hypothetical protein